MSECYIETRDKGNTHIYEYEEFIFDKTTNVSLTNIANHGIFTYNINATNITTDEVDNKWNTFVKVFIL